MQPAHVFCNMWDMLAGVNVPPGATSLGHVGCVFGHLATSAFCLGHGVHCQIPAADMDVTGTPCQDFSGCGNGQADQGPQMAIFLLWCHIILSRQTAILVHENVPEFWEALLHQHLGQCYWIYSCVMDCGEVGFRLMSRKRRYTIMYYKTKCRPLCHPVDLYMHLADRMQASLGHWQSQIWHCFLADCAEVAVEIGPLALKAGLSVAYAMEDMSRLLSVGELARLHAYVVAWIARFQQNPCFCPWAIFNLRDNPQAGWCTWSAVGGRIPCLRTGSQKLWSPYLNRWLTNKELLAAMGVPVYAQLANAAGVPLVEVSPGPDAWHMLGNMMHIASVGTAMFVALAAASPL